MKRLLPLLALVVASTSFAASRPDWSDDLEKAKQQAQAENKKIILDFTGSDWCGWCKKLDTEVFSQQEWKDYSAKHFVQVEVDFPHGFKLPPNVQKQNETLAAKYKVDGYPTIVVISPGGQLKGQGGYVEGGPKAFIKALEESEHHPTARR